MGNFTQDYHVILNRSNIEAVVICAPTDTHAQIIEAAAQAGKHIFCEKPIARNLPTIDRALATVAHAGVKLQIGFNRRFDASYRRVRTAIAIAAAFDAICRSTSSSSAIPRAL